MSSASRTGTRLVVHPLALAVQVFVASQAVAQTPPAEATLPAIKATAKADPATEGTGRYGARSASTATGLDLSLRETPQSVGVVPRTLIDDFQLNDANDLLTVVTGVNVERVEPDRSYFSIRGFEVSNFHIDGVGLPFATGDQIGNLDTALYDRVEVLRGANGLRASTGNPAGTVNFVRKRPTAELQASAALTLGSWNKRRLDADVSGALNASGSVRGRFTAAAQQGDSYLDRYSLDKHLFSAIVEADLGDDTLLALGRSQQRNRPNGVMWGSLPMFYADGSPARYEVSASSAPGWTYWDTDDVQTFAELTHGLGAGWQAKASLTQRELSSDAELFFVIGNADPASGTGLLSWPSKYGHSEKQWIGDLSLRGPFRLGGREHELLLGLNAGRSRNELHSSDDGGLQAITEAQMLAGTFPRPAFDKGQTGFADFANKRGSLYAVARFNATDALKIVAGANLTRATSKGESYDAVHDYRETRLTPYLGLAYALNGQHSLYASYAGIFNPQHQLDESGRVLDPIEGRSAELGAKGEWMDGHLNGSFAVFQVRQDNTPEPLRQVIVDEDTSFTAYRGVDATSTGFELDIAGTLARGWELSGGYTQLRIRGDDGAPVRTYVPRKTLRLATSYRLPLLPALKLGASLKWQSDFERTDPLGSASVVTHQDAYALLDLMARYELTPSLSVTAKLENATGKKYLNSLMWPGQTFYGAPRNGSVALRWTY